MRSVSSTSSDISITSAVKPLTSPLYYWVVPVNAEMPYVPSEPVAARKRFGLSVGYSEYATWEDGYAQFYFNAW